MIVERYQNTRDKIVNGGSQSKPDKTRISKDIVMTAFKFLRGKIANVRCFKR